MMKFIKHKNIFEAETQQSVEDVIQTINDIFQEFSDSGLEVTAMKNKKIGAGMRFSAWLLGAGIFPDIFTSAKSRQPQPFSFYADAIHHLLSFMKDSGYSIVGFSILYLDGRFPIHSVLFNEGKPKSPEIGLDPVAYCDRKFMDSQVKGVDISFKRV